MKHEDENLGLLSEVEELTAENIDNRHIYNVLWKVLIHATDRPRKNMIDVGARNKLLVNDSATLYLTESSFMLQKAKFER